MTFGLPSLLVALILPLWLLKRVWLAPLFSSRLPFDTTPQNTRSRWRWLIDSAESLPALLLACALLILAGPRSFEEPRSIRRVTNIEFCLDVSCSMAAPFGDGSRYDAAMGAINGFLGERDGDCFGLTIFGSKVLHWIPLTTDVSAFRCAPPFLRPERLPRWFNGTEIGRALLAAREVLAQRPDGDRMIILVSDGQSPDIMGELGERVARALSEQGIIVYAIHVADGAPPEDLVTITSGTGGELFAAGDQRGLEAVFARIDRMQKARLERVEGQAADDYGRFCMAGLAILALQLLGQFGLRYTPW